MARTKRIIDYWDNGEVREIRYERKGVLHHRTKPARAWFDADGNLRGVEYRHRGKMHRSGGRMAAFYHHRDDMRDLKISTGPWVIQEVWWEQGLWLRVRSTPSLGPYQLKQMRK